MIFCMFYTNNTFIHMSFMTHQNVNKRFARTVKRFFLSLCSLWQGMLTLGKLECSSILGAVGIQNCKVVK